MKIVGIKPIEGRHNHYAATIDGVEMLVVTRDGQSPEDVIREAMEQKLSYRERRLQEYPPINEQLDMIYHDIDAWRATIAAIKAKHPAP